MAGEKSPAWIAGLKGDGVAPSVVWFDTEFPIYTTPGEYLVVRTSLDCDGRSMQPAGEWRGLSKSTGKRIVFKGCGVLTMGTKGVDLFPGIFQDRRTLRQMQDGCCPPQITEDQIRKERFEDTEGDAVLEAMKLRKRGYFGGGG